MTHPARRRAWAGPRFCVALYLLSAGPAIAQERWYGLAGGAVAPLGDTRGLGAWLALSAAQPAELRRSPAAAMVQGAVHALLTSEQWALLPTLGADLLIPIGPVQLSFGAGVELFGVARQQSWTVFATFGLMGGLGAVVPLADDLRLGLRARAVWLPGPASAILDQPKVQGEKPSFVYLFGGLSLEYWFRM